jgi:uncharacterized protein
MDAKSIIKALNLQPHPAEGGFYRETYRADESFPVEALPSRYAGKRSVSTAIYYLLTPDGFSAMHRLQSDEIFHFHAGGSATILMLHPDGQGETAILGADVLAGERPQVVVPKGVWQGLFLNPGGQFALLGTTVAPGFEFADFELGSRESLIRQYPAFGRWIERLT